MPKKCKVDDCDYNCFGGGYCLRHQYLRTDIKKRVNRVSKKRSVDNKVYSALALQYKIDNPFCRIGAPGCTLVTTDVHHKKGRGIWLLIVKFWIPACRCCHDYVGANPKWAIEHGFSINRIT